MADNAKILATLADIVKDTTAGAVPQDQVTLEKSFMDELDIDSLTMVEIAVQTEEKLGVRIPDEELPSLKTVADAVNYIAARSA